MDTVHLTTLIENLRNEGAYIIASIEGVVASLFVVAPVYELLGATKNKTIIAPVEQPN